MSVFGGKSRRVEPGPGQESAWDYPRPPRLEKVGEALKVVFAGVVVAESRGGYRVLETSHPPTYYIPPEDVRTDLLTPAPGDSVCEWKGQARYWTLKAGGAAAERAAWSYASPVPAFAPLKEHFAFYASKVDACFVGDEQVHRQEGDFYGGWITSKIVGPFKGGTGTWGW